MIVWLLNNIFDPFYIIWNFAQKFVFLESVGTINKYNIQILVKNSEFIHISVKLFK